MPGEAKSDDAPYRRDHQKYFNYCLFSAVLCDPVATVVASLEKVSAQRSKLTVWIAENAQNQLEKIRAKPDLLQQPEEVLVAGGLMPEPEGVDQGGMLLTASSFYKLSLARATSGHSLRSNPASGQRPA